MVIAPIHPPHSRPQRAQLQPASETSETPKQSVLVLGTQQRNQARCSLNSLPLTTRRLRLFACYSLHMQISQEASPVIQDGRAHPRLDAPFLSKNN